MVTSNGGSHFPMCSFNSSKVVGIRHYIWNPNVLHLSYCEGKRLKYGRGTSCSTKIFELFPQAPPLIPSRTFRSHTFSENAWQTATKKQHNP